MKRSLCLGVILAGGASSRMGAEKTLVPLAGKPLLAHVIARLAPQIAALALNANGDPARFAQFGLPIFPDPATPGAKREGPLAGVIAALRFARAQGYETLATVPGDAPFLPLDLTATLSAALRPHQLFCLARSPTGLEPLFGLWRTAALETLDAAFARGERAIHRLAIALDHGEAQFSSANPDPFANINTPEELAAAATAFAALHNPSGP
jgi:molybdenum cofactor guanylyltransferase